MSARLSISDIKSSFGSEGYRLLSTIYRNNRQKLKFVCPEGHKHSIAWTKWQQGNRCFFCRGTPKLRLDDIKFHFAKEGYLLESKEYIGAREPISFVCPEGHRHRVSWNNWKRGVRCGYCYGRYVTIGYVATEFDKEGYKLLSREYVNSDQKLRYVCPRGHRHSIRWRHWTYGARCYHCGVEDNSGENCHLWKSDSVYDLSEFKDYQALVVSITNQSYKKYRHLVDPKDYGRGDDHELDHIFSIADGFRYGVDPKIVASPVNLRVVTTNENRAKGSKSLITVEELRSKYQSDVIDEVVFG